MQTALKKILSVSLDIVHLLRKSRHLKLHMVLLRMTGSIG